MILCESLQQMEVVNMVISITYAMQLETQLEVIQYTCKMVTSLTDYCQTTVKPCHVLI